MLKKKKTGNAPLSKPLVLETVFIAMMLNIIFIYCKVSRTNDFSCVLRVLQKADFEIYKLFLFFFLSNVSWLI